jgi:hypothetical protein
VHRPAAPIAFLTGVALLLLSGRYGYHRDELYFLQAGRHLAWGFPDQPPLTPLLAMLSGHSLVLLRLPSTLSTAVVVYLAGRMARDLGARRDGELLASGSTALCGFVLATGHLLSTATTAILGSTVVTFLLVRLLLGGDRRLWFLLGLVAGVTLQANVFPAALLAALGVGLGVTGRLRHLGPWIAGLLALAVISPYLLWQGQHGWPQVDVARGIAAGKSGSSVSRLLFVPLQVLQVGPWLLPIWLTGLRRALHDERLRTLGIAFPVLQLALLTGGGKPYYAAGLYPFLLAAGAQQVADRVRRSWVLLVLSTPALVFALPILPISAAGIALTVNPDVGETIGWPEFAAQVAAVRPPAAAVLTQNYGQAGAVDRFGSNRAFSAHNAYAGWGPPPGQVSVLAVGLPQQTLNRLCLTTLRVGTIRSPHDLDNHENGTALVVCVPSAPWAQVWPSLRHLD